MTDRNWLPADIVDWLTVELGATNSEPPRYVFDDYTVGIALSRDSDGVITVMMRREKRNHFDSLEARTNSLALLHAWVLMEFHSVHRQGMPTVGMPGTATFRRGTSADIAPSGLTRTTWESGDWIEHRALSGVWTEGAAITQWAAHSIPTLLQSIGDPSGAPVLTSDRRPPARTTTPLLPSTEQLRQDLDVQVVSDVVCWVFGSRDRGFQRLLADVIHPGQWEVAIAPPGTYRLRPELRTGHREVAEGWLGHQWANEARRAVGLGAMWPLPNVGLPDGVHVERGDAWTLVVWSNGAKRAWLAPDVDVEVFAGWATSQS